MRSLILTASVFLSGCVTHSLTAERVFPPPTSPLGPDMTIEMEEILSSDGDGELDLRFDLNGDVSRTRIALAQFAGLSVQKGYLDTDQGSVGYALFAHEDGPDRVIVHCTGSGVDLQQLAMLAVVKAAPHGDVLQFDYVAARGEASLASVRDSTGAAAELAIAHAKGASIVFWGYSSGALACADMARRYRVDALILEAPPVNTIASATRLMPGWVRPLVTLELSEDMTSHALDRKLAGYEGPVLLLSGGRDDVVLTDEVEELCQRLVADGVDARCASFADANHLSISMQPGFTQAIATFLAGTT